METPEPETIQEFKSPLFPFSPNIYMIAVTANNGKAEIRSLNEFMSAQSDYADRRYVLASVEKPRTGYNLDRDGAVLRVSALYGILRRVVPAFLRPLFFHLCHYSFLSGHHTERRMYDSLRKKLYRPHMAKYVYAIVYNCRFYEQKHTHGKRQRQLSLFFPKGPLFYIGMYILVPLPRSKQGIKCVDMMTYCYTKLTKAIQNSKTSATIVARLFLEQYMDNYGIPSRLLADNGQNILVEALRRGM